MSLTTFIFSDNTTTVGAVPTLTVPTYSSSGPTGPENATLYAPSPNAFNVTEDGIVLAAVPVAAAAGATASFTLDLQVTANATCRPYSFLVSWVSADSRNVTINVLAANGTLLSSNHMVLSPREGGFDDDEDKLWLPPGGGTLKFEVNQVALAPATPAPTDAADATTEAADPSDTGAPVTAPDEPVQYFKLEGFKFQCYQ